MYGVVTVGGVGVTLRVWRECTPAEYAENAMYSEGQLVFGTERLMSDIDEALAEIRKRATD